MHTPMNDQIESQKGLSQPGKFREPDSLPAFTPPSGAPSKRKRAAVTLLGVLLALGALWVAKTRWAAVAKKPAANARAESFPVPVVAGTVAQRDVPIYLDGLGTVQAFNTVTVHVRVDGQLEKLLFKEGQDVHVGDLLAQIDPSPFQAQLDQALAKRGQDEAQLNLQRVELKREAALLAAKIDSQDAYDQVAAQVKALEAAVNADQAAIESANVQLGYTRITSPIEGRVGIQLVDVGNIVHATDATGLVVITQLRPIEVIFTLPEQTLGEIQNQEIQGAPAVLAVDRDNRTVLDEGKLAVIDNQIDPTTGTIKLKAVFPNPDLRLWPGQFVNARLLVTTRKAGIVVPAPVIQRGPEGPYAFVIKPDATVEIRPVKVAQIQDGVALIDDGLSAGEQVVVDGQYKLQAHSRVKVAGAGKAGPAAGEDSKVQASAP